MSSYATVDEYIAACPKEYQPILYSLRTFIKSIATEKVKEVISYGMPTYKASKNILHFALNKSHIGIYPGAEAIVFFENDLKEYKTSKGAIHLPLDKPLPKKLIQKLFQYNLQKQIDKQHKSWDSYRHLWVDAYECMNEIIVQFSTLQKTQKWGTDVYTYKAKNLVSWSGFKNFFSLWFYNGVFLIDNKGYLMNASEGKTKSLRQWRFKSVDELREHEKEIKAYIKESMQIIDDGKHIPSTKSNPLLVPKLLQESLDSNEDLYNAFNVLSVSKRNEYITYIEEAKQEKTKLSRIDKIIPLVLSGKGLNDKYKK
jgi:uncharacterized protein YdeI (YjbR/CyaY-like superfamily)